MAMREHRSGRNMRPRVRSQPSRMRWQCVWGDENRWVQLGSLCRAEQQSLMFKSQVHCFPIT